MEERFGVKGMLSDDDCEGRVFEEMGGTRIYLRRQ